MAKDWAEIGRANEKRHAAAKHRQRGVGKKDPVLEQGRRVERSHSQAKHKRKFAFWKEGTKADDEEIGRWRREYYKEARPDIDPQSTYSKVMEFVGMDNPYVPNEDSYDYRSERWRRERASGDPDLSWSVPEIGPQMREAATDAYNNVFRGTAVPAQEAYEKARDSVDGEYTPQDYYDDEVSQFRARNGRDPTPEEAEQIKMRLFDPRTYNEKNAAAVLNLLDFPLAGFGEEAAAGAMSVIPGRGTYEQELDLARRIQGESDLLDPITSPRVILPAIAGFIAGGGPIGAAAKGAEKVIGVGRKAFGMAPQATTRVGRAATTAASGGAVGAGDFAAYQYGSGEGGHEERMKAIDPMVTAAGGVAGGVVFPAVGAAFGAGARGTKKAVKAAVDRFKPKPRASVTADAGPRDDIEKAIRRSQRK